MRELLSELSHTQNVFCYTLLALVAVQLFYTLFFYLKLALYTPKETSPDAPPVSVIVCARNESDNLKNFIPIMMDQQYSNFEVVVVNDSSWDDSEDILKALQVRFSNLKVIRLNENVHRMTGKKFALTMGIKGAAHDRLLFTDADCYPLSPMWISDMMKAAQEEQGVVLGVSLMEREKGLSKNFFRFESIHTALNYCSMALRKAPYMGVGRNLTYTKEKFFSVGGFKKHMHVTGGDDDLFINEISSNSVINICPQLEAHTTSKSPNGWSAWWTQKRRHIDTSGLYKRKSKALLGLEPLTWWLMWVCIVVLLVLRTPALLVITPVALRYLLLYGTFMVIGRKWKAIDAVWAMPLWEIVLNISKPLILISNLISKPKRWM